MLGDHSRTLSLRWFAGFVALLFGLWSGCSGGSSSGSSPTEEWAAGSGPSLSRAAPGALSVLPDSSAPSLSGRHIGSVVATAWSPNGQWLATGSWDGNVRLWSAVDGRPHRILVGLTEEVGGLAFSPDSSYLAAASRNSIARVWELRSGRAVADLIDHTDSVEAISWSPDGRYIATGSWDGTIRLWSASTWQEERRIDGRGEGMLSLAFSPNGARLAAGSQDGTVWVWDLASDQRRVALSEAGAAVYALGWSADSRALAAGLRDGRLVLGLLDQGNPVRTETIGEPILAVAFSRDGRSVATAGWSGEAKHWDAETGNAQPTKSKTGKARVLDGALRID